MASAPAFELPPRITTDGRAADAHLSGRADGPFSEARVVGDRSERSRRKDIGTKKGVPWSESEHLAFLMGLKKLGKGNWRGVSKYFVPTRTPTQVASHAQKHFLRIQGVSKRKSRFSIVENSATAQGLVHKNEVQSTEEATFVDHDRAGQSHGAALRATLNGQTVYMHNYFAGSLNSLPMQNVWRNSMQATSATSDAQDMNSSICGPKGEGLSWLPPGSGFYYARAPQPMSLPQSCSSSQPKDIRGNSLVPLFPKICRPTAYYAPRPKDEDELRRKPKFFQEKHGSLTVSSQSAFHSTHGYPIQV